MKNRNSYELRFLFGNGNKPPVLPGEEESALVKRVGRAKSKPEEVEKN